MSVEARQLTLLVIAFAVPAVFMLTGRRKYLLGWIGFTLTVHIFDTAIFTNLTAGRVAGLLYLPVAISQLPVWSRWTPARAWLVNFLYLVVLGAVFGFLWPWPDITGHRPLMLLPQGRTAIYLVRMISEVSLTVLVVQCLVEFRDISHLTRSIAFGAAASALTGIASRVTGTDYYLLITGLREYVDITMRPRGLSVEPRALGLACAYAAILLLLRRRRSSVDWVLLVSASAGLLTAFSTSAFITFVAGLAVVLIFGSTRSRIALLLVGVIITGGVIAWLNTDPAYIDDVSALVEARLGGYGTVEANRTFSFVERVLLRLEVFDASAALFLYRNPRYIVTGTGPGLVSLPASSHIPEGVWTQVFVNGIDSLPFHGVLHEVANSGIVGLLAWIIQVWSSDRAIRAVGWGNFRSAVREMRATFLVGVVFFVIQVGASPYWAVFRAFGWRAVRDHVARREAATTRRPHRTAAIPA